MPDEAVLDVAVDTEVDTAADTGLDVGAEPQVEGAEPVSEPGQAAIEAPTKPLIDGGKLSAEAKKHLDELKATNPTLARALQRELFKGAELAKALPGGVKEVQELRATVEQLGGPNGIQEIQQEVNGWHQFDEQYMAGDPKAVEFMTSEPEGQEAFLKLVPSAMQKWEQLHPEGFSNYMAQVILGTMGQHGVPLALERLADFIGDNPKAQEQYNKLLGFYKAMGAIASKQVEAPKFAKKDVPDDGRAQFEQERTAFEREKWKNETAGEQRQVFESEWTRLANGRKLSAAQEAAVKELFESRLNKAINGKHAETLQRYFQAKDKSGFMRYASSISRTEVPKALREAFDAVVPGKPGPRPSNGAAPAKNGQPGRGVPIAQGFTQVAAQPATHEIDYRNPFNTPANFQLGRAVLIGGKKVTWQKKA